MTQHVDLKRYVALTSRYRAVIFVSVRGDGNVKSIRINDHKGFQNGAMNFKRESDSIIMRARTDSYQIQFIVEFASYGWCDDLILTLETIPRNSSKLYA
ncbi:unnamed protein product [Rotaria sp. Silwood2]|nr:unnamed protein product [Rotaria sp. Silwood2]